MTVSSSSDFTTTRDQIITEALELIGVLDAGATPETADVTSAAMSLNLMVKALQSDRIYLWAVDEQNVALVDGTASYSLDTGTTRVLSAWLEISGSVYPVDMIDRDTFEATPTPATEGQPYNLWVDYATDAPTAWPIPVPDASYTLYYRRERKFYDFDAASDNADFPVKAHDMLVSGLCHRLASKFQLPITERQYWERQFEKARNEYRAGDHASFSRKIVAPNHVV